MPGYSAIFKHPNDELNYCYYLIPHGKDGYCGDVHVSIRCLKHQMPSVMQLFAESDSLGSITLGDSCLRNIEVLLQHLVSVPGDVAKPL